MMGFHVFFLLTLMSTAFHNAHPACFGVGRRHLKSEGQTGLLQTVGDLHGILFKFTNKYCNSQLFELQEMWTVWHFLAKVQLKREEPWPL